MAPSPKPPQPPTGEIASTAEQIKKALECDCVKELRDGPCGRQFVDAFTCFHMSTEAVKGGDCFLPNKAFAECLGANPSVATTKEGGSMQMPRFPSENPLVKT
eukprot:gene26009-11701_t